MQQNHRPHFHAAAGCVLGLTRISKAEEWKTERTGGWQAHNLKSSHLHLCYPRVSNSLDRDTAPATTCPPCAQRRVCFCHAFHVLWFNQGGDEFRAEILPILSWVLHLHNSGLGGGITSLSSLSDLGSVVLQCRREPFHLELADLMILRLFCNHKQEGGTQTHRTLGSGTSVGPTSWVAVWYQGTEERSRAILESERSARRPGPVGS